MNEPRFETTQQTTPSIHRGEEIFCYHCRRHHPRGEMLQIVTKSGKRWRCRTSLNNARRQPHERDAFGRETTNNNRSDDKRRADLANMLRAMSRWG